MAKNGVIVAKHQKLIALPCCSSPCSVMHIHDKLVAAGEEGPAQQLQKWAIISKVAEVVKA